MKMKTRRSLLASLLAPCLCLALSNGALPAGSAADALAAGIRQVHEGEFDQAVVTLDGVVRRLVAERAPASQIAKAHVYLAIAYMGLAQVEQARERFIEALKADKTMELSPKEFPPNVVELLAQVKGEESKPQATAPGAVAASTAAPPAVKARQRGAAPSTRTARGTLRIYVVPWADIDVDGGRAGTSPPLAPLSLSAGDHTITLFHPDYRPLRRKVWVRAGETVRMHVSLPDEAFPR